MRYHVLRTLETVGGGTRVKEEDLVAWANATAAAAAVGGGTGAGGGGGKGTPASTAAASAPPRIGSLRDPALATGGFLAALLGGLSPGCVNPALLAPGDTPQARLQNAKRVLRRRQAAQRGAVKGRLDGDHRSTRPLRAFPRARAAGTCCRWRGSWARPSSWGPRTSLTPRPR